MYLLIPPLSEKNNLSSHNFISNYLISIFFTGKITLHDLKQCKLTNVFFDTFFNIEKYLDHEQKDQFSMLRVSMKF